MTRRVLVAGMTCYVAHPTLAASASDDRLLAIERRIGGRVGVMILDTGSGRRLSHRAGERFPLCSSFKWLLAAATLARVDRGVERLDRRIAYSKADLIGVSPITEAHVSEGALSIGQLSEAAIIRSDNGAANLLLAALGGPARLTAWLRTQGDLKTRLDRNEPSLNTAVPGDPRDTTTPAAMVQDLGAVLLGDALSPASRDRLTGWLVDNRTGDARLRAGTPKGWRIGDKTGTGAHATNNDVAIVWPPGGKPILIASYLTAGTATDAEREAAHAEIGRIAAALHG